jgi:predicted patatin/cPLA2 family phospholipase
MIYKSSEKDCCNCPFKNQCTKSKNKQILRHIWEGYKEMANEYRHQDDVKEIYRQRPQHIERVFADGKTKYGLIKTYFRGKERVHRELTLLYACMNLKKFALHHYA